MALKRANTDGPFLVPKESYNAFVDAAEAHRNRVGVIHRSDLFARDDSGIITIRNDSGSDRDRFDVLAIGDPIILPTDNLNEFKNRVSMAGTTPSMPDDAGKIAVLLEPLGTAKIGKAMVSGVIATQVKMNDVDHPRCGFVDSSYTLASGQVGPAEILWTAVTSDGETGWAVIRFPTAATTNRFPAIITGNATYSYRWKYAWSEAEYSGDSLTTKSGGRSGTTSTDYALNRVEVNHTSTLAFGTDQAGSGYPSGFEPRPVGAAGNSNTHDYDVPVEMTEVIDLNGDVRYWFELIWTHDGPCS